MDDIINIFIEAKLYVTPSILTYYLGSRNGPPPSGLLIEKVETDFPDFLGAENG